MDRRLRALLLTLSPLSFGCDELVRIDGGDTACIPTAVQAAFDRSCARSGCHDDAGAAAGLVLTAGSSAGVIGRQASQQPLPLVTVGDPQGSYMAHKLMTAPPTPIAGTRMPVGFDVANTEQVADAVTILAWIAGAEMAGCESGTGGDTTTGGEIPSGLPCEIDELLARRCRSCHSDPPLGAPMPLVTHENLLAGTPSDPVVSVAARAAQRMADAAAPMPPAPGTPVTADELAAFDAWLAAGAPTEDCQGGGDTGGEPNPFDVDPVCTSNQFWVGDEGDPHMFPGRDCISCHTAERLEDPGDDGIPDLVVGGTVYPTGHEPNDCFGTSAADLRVVIASMASGDEVSLAPNSTGNFLLHRVEAPAGFEPPFLVKLVEGERERVMAVPAPGGSCNACHTQQGTGGAPGRVVRP